MTPGTQPMSLRCLVESRSARALALLLLLVLALPLLLAACGDDGVPPEQTLSSLGSKVGDANLDNTDFEALLAGYTVPEYAADIDADLANYQLYLTGKAAQLALNEPEPPDLVQTEKDEDSGSARVSFVFSRKEGLFAVADISRIDVDLVVTENTDNPWRIRRISLAR